EAERGEIAAIASAPETDALRVDVRTALQEFPGGNNVLVFRGATTGAAGRFTERAAIANAAAVIQREDNVTAAREILIHGVGIRVVVHVVPAEKHLANRAAVQKNQRGTLVAGFGLLWNKQLAVDFEAIGGFEDGLLGSDETVKRKI